MFAVILLPPLLFAVVGGLGVSILAVGFLGQKKPWFGKKRPALFLGDLSWCFYLGVIDRVDSCWSGWFKQLGRLSSTVAESFNAWSGTCICTTRTYGLRP